jgi:hypothetical protein
VEEIVMKKLSTLTTLVVVITIVLGLGNVVADTGLVSQPRTINIDVPAGAGEFIGIGLSVSPPPVCALSVLKTATPDTIVPSPGPGCSTGDEPTSLTFKYTGESCAASDHDQDDKAKCSGDPGFREPVFVVYTGKDPDQIT